MRRLFLGCIAHLFMFSTLFSQQAGTLTGRIVTPDGAPIPGAKITFPDWNEVDLIGQATTGRDGKFSMSVRESENLRLHRNSPALLVEADGCAATYVHERHLTVFPNATKDLGDVVLDAGGKTYSGRAVDETGTPIAGATVKCCSVRYYLGHTILPIGDAQLVRTDSDGRFCTPMLPFAMPEISIQADGFVLKFYGDSQIRDCRDGRLPDLVIKPDTPIQGVLKNEQGEPIPDATVAANSDATTKTDEQGRFVLRGFAKDATFQLQTAVDGYLFVNWGVTSREDGFEYSDVGRDAPAVRIPELDITLQREAQIRGRVVDAETNLPVAISGIILCNFTRRANGEIVTDGCRDSRFIQPTPGTFSIAYSYPTEYHLTVTAEGYEEGEGFTPFVTSLQPIDDIVVKLKRKSTIASASIYPRIVGTVTDVEKPLDLARVALWRCPKEENAINAYIVRGRTTTGDGYVAASQLLHDGQFSLEAPYADDTWYLLVETPQRIVAVHGPISAKKGESTSVPLTTQESGGLKGVVTNMSAATSPLFAVIFSDIGIQYESRVQADGSFEFTNVYPGIYGLKVGCDSIRDTEVPELEDRKLSPDELAEIERRPSQPWKRAKRVQIDAGKVIDSIDVEFEP